MSAPKRTPRAWRLAALAILGGGAAGGLLATRGGAARASVAIAIGIVAGYVGPIARATRRPPIPPAPAPIDPATRSTRPPTFTVLVGARDEAAVLPELVADVAAQRYRDATGRPCFELVIVDDRSTDGTADAALTAAAEHAIAGVTRIVRREGADLPDGKGAALTAAQPETCSGDVVVVLDADARIGPTFLGTLAHYIEAGAPAVTARRRILGARTSDLAGAQNDEQTLDGELQRGRWGLGGCSEFRGNGIVVRRDLLAAVGGWRAEALTEDLDLSSRVAAEHGLTVAWAIDAEVWEEPVRTWLGLIRQRVRWAEGAIRRTFEHAPAVLVSERLPLAARLDFAAYVGQLLAPPLLIGAFAGGLMSRRLGPALALLAAYGSVGAILGWDALRWETDDAGRPLAFGERCRRTARVTLFGGVWLWAVPAALWRLATRRGAVTYDKMPHDGGGEAR